MSDFDLIDVESLDYSDEQTWLHKVPGDSGQHVDMVDWGLSLDWPVYSDDEYQETETTLYAMLDEILKSQVLAMPDKHKFDSRTYVKPKRSPHRPSIQTLVEAHSNPPSLSNTNKYMTYNKYSNPLAPILRLKTFNVEANTENSNAVKEFALKRRSLVQEDDDPQLEDIDIPPTPDVADRLEHFPTKPITIDYSQPANYLHNTFNKGMLIGDRGSLNMYQSGESLMRMSPPSLVSSLLMESSGNFNPESLDGRRSINMHRDSGIPPPGRDSIDPLVTSMTLSILEDKDMSTSFLSQTTYPEHDGIMDSLPPSLVSSVNSSFVVSRGKDSIESNSNVFSSATFTHLEQSEKLLSARPRHTMYNSFTKRENPMRNSCSYTKAREEGCQIDNSKILNENSDKTISKLSKSSNEMTETITLHYSNNKFRRNNDAEKENLDASFEKDDAFYKDMDMQRTVDLGRNSLNVTLDKQELNEIIQARQKLSLARKALPTDNLPNQVDISPKTSPNQTVVPLPRKSIENASELLSRRRTNGYDSEEPVREPPQRNSTFRKPSPKTSMDATMVVVKDEPIIDINMATMNLIDSSDRTLQQGEWGSQERAMVASSESTDTHTFSSSSPPDSVPDTQDPKMLIGSTPLAARKDNRCDLLNLHNTISPIYNMVDDKSYTVTKAPSTSSSSDHNTTAINTMTMVRRSAKRDILSGKTSPDKKMSSPTQMDKTCKLPNTASYSIMPPPPAPLTLAKKAGLPTSKLRQYSSHKELRLPVATAPSTKPQSRPMLRRNVYASNPALSPTARRDSYTVLAAPPQNDVEPPRPVLTNPPVLVRQGTETLRRDRPVSQMVQPKDLRAGATSAPVAMRNLPKPAPVTRPYSIAGSAPFKVTQTRPNSVPYKATPAAPSVPTQEPRSCSEARISALPRPSRLPGPRRTLRPPSVYSVAPTADVDHY